MKLTRDCLAIAVAALAVIGPPNADAQVAGERKLAATVFVGSDGENYLRLLQTLGLTALYPYSARAFSPAELTQIAPVDTGHPWAGAAPLLASRRTIAGVSVEATPLQVSGWYNTNFAFGINDGAVWVGRGVTAAAQGGVGVRSGA